MTDLLADSAPSNAPEWTVSELSQALKRTVEDAFGHVRIRGEISGYRGPAASGHAYFSLKDENARIDAVVWKGTLSRLKARPEEGMEVIAHGRLTTFPGKSSYQIVIERLEPAGLGALMAMLEERRRRLAAEGLFDEARKRPLPFLPTVIGVVTSPTGAVIRDILHRLADRFPRQVIVWPVRVQGETSAAEVAAAIAGFNALPEGGPIPRPDLLIVARGGGSLEDLWSFNEEIVVRAAAASAIPLIAAVGHETDWTLIDHVADRRAPTPTGAAEIAVPVRSELLAVSADLGGRLAAATIRLVEQRRNDLRNVARVLPTPDTLLATPRQRLDLIGGRLTQALVLATRRHQQVHDALARRLAAANPANRLALSRGRLDAVSQRLDRSLAIGIARKRDLYDARASRLVGGLLQRRAEQGRERLTNLSARLATGYVSQVRQAREKLASNATLLTAYSYQGVLARGFALVRDSADHPVRLAEGARTAGDVSIQFADGRVGARILEGRPVRAAPKAKPSSAQPGLFDD